VVFEGGIEHRFGMPVLPVADYGQALCGECGLLYLNAPLSDAYLLRLYSQENVEWQAKYLSENTVVWNGGTTEEELRRFESVVDMASRFRNVQGARWLDFGCQTGELGEIARARHSASMFGVEVSASYAARADERWGGRGTVRSSLSSFVEEGRKFDVISSLETLEHLAAPWDTVAALRTLLAPGGILIVTVPSAQYFRLKFRVFKALRRLSSRRASSEGARSTGRSLFGLCHTHPYNFSPRSLSHLLERGGFSPIFVGGSGWSSGFWCLESIARSIAFAPRDRVQIFPSVIAVAKSRD
jgi:2-polyprenyl-3-methyl-5-hydroxy-6-metoxy-1,4-benzoquinol methylase